MRETSPARRAGRRQADAGRAARVLWVALVATVAVHGVVFAQTAPGTAARHLVVPFQNTSTDPRAYWLTEASAVIVTDDLIALGVPVISRDDRLRAFERLRVPSVATLSHATVIRLGQVVGAMVGVVGEVDLDGETVTVRARTIRLDAGRISEALVERGPLAELFAIYARLVRRIVPDSGVTLERMEENHPAPAAFEQYIKGLLAQAPDTRVSYLTQALRLAPAFMRARIALWSIYNDEGEHRRALAAVREVPAGHRLARQAEFLGAVSMLNLNDAERAFEVLDRLNTARPDPALLNDLGVAQLRKPAGVSGPRAASFFADALKLDAADPDLYFNLGYAYWLEKDAAGAIAALREAVRRNPADAEAHFVLGVALQASAGAVEGARERELARRLSSDVDRFESSGTATVPRGLERIKTDVDVPSTLRVEAAIAEAGQRDQRELTQFHLDAGRRLFQAQRDAEAISELRRAVYLSPYQSEAHLLLGRLYLRSGRTSEAVDAFKISIWSADTPTAHVALAEAYIAIKDPAAARTELELVLKRDAANAEAKRLMNELP